MPISTLQNLDAEPLAVGQRAYCSITHSFHIILQVKACQDLETGLAYLILENQLPNWYDASYFWSEEQLQELILQEECANVSRSTKS